MRGVYSALNPHRPSVASVKFDADTRFRSCSFSFFSTSGIPVLQSMFILFFDIWDVKASSVMLSISNTESTQDSTEWHFQMGGYKDPLLPLNDKESTTHYFTG